MAIFFSPSQCAFYAGVIYESYVAAGTWPDDAKEMDEETAQKYQPSNQPYGKRLGATKDGMPTWIDEVISDELKIEINMGKKRELLSEATTKITVWQTKLLMGRKLSDADTKALNTWMDYIDAVDAIEAETTQEITWPKVPQ